LKVGETGGWKGREDEEEEVRNYWMALKKRKDTDN
jgi:hypothetical protein